MKKDDSSKESRSKSALPSLELALDWVKKNRISKSGVRVHHLTDVVSPEVTGYLIESLYNAGEKDFAFDLAEWEASIQQKDGSFLAPGDSVAYTFDTAQIIRGFLAVVDEYQEFESHLVKACDYVTRNISAKGEVLTPSYDMWVLSNGEMLSEYGNLYVLPPLFFAGVKLNQPRYLAAAKRGMEYFRTKKDLVEFKPQLGTLSHYFGYMMEALVDLGEVDLANAGLAQAEAVMKPDGKIPAFPGATWVCPTGVAQLGIAWAKLKNFALAQKAHRYLMKIQNPSGGFFGGIGRKVPYFDNQEISWAAKFFIDLSLLVET